MGRMLKPNFLHFSLCLTIGCVRAGSGPDAPRTEQTQQTSCQAVEGVAWKSFLARLVHDAAADFGRWEFTTDLYESNGRLQISEAGLAQCAARGHTGCPAVVEALSAQDGE